MTYYDDNPINLIQKINELYKTNFKSIDQYDIITESNICFYRNKKCEDYYVHTYDPLIFSDIPDIYKDMCVLDKKEKCCNCVSFIMYNNKDKYIEATYEYLYSLKISVINIRDCLDDFIARIYLDSFVFRHIQTIIDIQNDIGKYTQQDLIYYKCVHNILNFLFNEPKVEIYIYTCDTKDYYLKTLRFMPLIDPEVNIKISREADGYVTYVDCLNIKEFIKSKKLLLLYDLASNSSDNITLLNKSIYPMMHLPYSEWLKHYISYDKFFMTHIPICDIYAGLFGCSMQIKKESYINSTNNIKKSLTVSIPHGDGYSEITLHHINGYDEIILLDLFKKIISIERHNDSPSVISDINKYMGKEIKKEPQLNKSQNYKKEKKIFDDDSREFFEITEKYTEKINEKKNYIAYVDNTIILQKDSNDSNLSSIIQNFFNTSNINSIVFEPLLYLSESFYDKMNMFIKEEYTIILIDAILKYNKYVFNKITNIEHYNFKRPNFLNSRRTILSTVGLANYYAKDIDINTGDFLAEKIYTIQSELKGGYLKYKKYHFKLKIYNLE